VARYPGENAEWKDAELVVEADVWHLEFVLNFTSISMFDLMWEHTSLLFGYDVSVCELACPSYVSSIVLGDESDILEQHLDSEICVV
jgi:hypothetical protein